MSKPYTRAPKQLGDFGELLVAYVLSQQNFEISVVDHVGADLMASRNDSERYAVSVKTHRYTTDAKTKESLSFTISNSELQKLQHFAKTFKLRELVAQVVCFEKDWDESVRKPAIHVFIIDPSEVPRQPTRVSKVRMDPKRGLVFHVKHLLESPSTRGVTVASWCKRRWEELPARPGTGAHPMQSFSGGSGGEAVNADSLGVRDI